MQIYFIVEYFKNVRFKIVKELLILKGYKMVSHEK